MIEDEGGIHCCMVFPVVRELDGKEEGKAEQSTQKCRNQASDPRQGGWRSTFVEVALHVAGSRGEE